jgi:hypothetical protein
MTLFKSKSYIYVENIENLRLPLDQNHNRIFQYSANNLLKRDETIYRASYMK